MTDQSFGTFLARIREEKGMSRKELAKKSRVSARKLGKWEQGKTLPDFAAAEALSGILGISTLELIRAKRFGSEEKDTGSTREMEALVHSAASQQRELKAKMPVKNVIILVLAVTSAILAVFLVDEISSNVPALSFAIFAAMIIEFPIVTFIDGLILVVFSVYRVCRKQPHLKTMVAGLILMVCALFIIAFPFAGFALGLGPAPD